MVKKPKDSLIVKIYLIIYNTLQFLGWGAVLVEVFKHFSAGKTDYQELWKNAHIPLAIFQTLQMIEVLHAAIKLVPSSPVTTFMQIISRIIVLWCILIPIKETRSSIGLPLILTAWSIAETTRYLYYALNVVNLVPYLLTWCRYSFFLVLYPTGVSGELTLMYSALPLIVKRELLFYKLPNVFNISFYTHYLLIGLMLSYIPFFPKLFFYMVSQRGKALGGKSKSA